MKKANAILAVMLACFVSASARAEEKNSALSPRLYMSVLSGFSYEKSSSGHNFHVSVVQVGATLFETQHLLFGKVALTGLMGYNHDAKNCDDDTTANDVGSCGGVQEHWTLVFSPVLVKIAGLGREYPALTLDIGVDYEKRLVAALGVAF